MNIYSINSYTPNIYSRRNTGYAALPQVNFHGIISKVLTKDVVSITKKFEELSPKEQRQTLFETLNNSPHFSLETLRNLMKFKDKSIPLIKELYELTKNDEYFTGGMAFYDMDEEDLPARIEFYKKYKEEQHVTINHDLNVLCHINRYNLPLAKLIGIRGYYDDNEIKLVQNTTTKKRAQTIIDGYNTLKNAIPEEDFSYAWRSPYDLCKILNNMESCSLPLLKRMSKNKHYIEDPQDIIEVLNCTGKDNIASKIKIFDLMEEIDHESNNIDVLQCTDNKNYSLVEFLVKDEEFPWDSISKVASLVKPEDCKSKIEIYECIDKSSKPDFDWNSITNIMYRTNRYNIDFAKALVNDKNIPSPKIEHILSHAPSKELKDIKFYAYNLLKDRSDIENCGNIFADAIRCVYNENIDIFNVLVANPKFDINNIVGILRHNINSEEKKKLFLRLINETTDEMTGSDVEKIANDISNNNLKIAEKICFDEKISTEDKLNFMESTAILIRRTAPNGNDFLCDLDLHKLIDNYKKMHQTVLNNPAIYINGDDSEDFQGMVDEINEVFRREMAGVMLASHIFDMKTLDDLFRMRLDFVEDYLEELVNLDIENLKLLKSLCDAKNVDGKPLSSKQKIEMFDLLQAYREFDDAIMYKMYDMAEKNVVDIEELNSILLTEIFSDMDINISDIPKEKLRSWNLKYIHLLSEELKDIDFDSEKLFKSVINAANSNRSFKDFIQDPTNEFGYNNKATMLDFKELKMDYDKWVNPDKKNNVHFVHKDENKEKLSQISDQIEEDINTLLHSMDEVVKSYDKNPIRKILYNSFGEYMVREGYGESSDRFVIPENIRESKANLIKLVKSLSETHSRESAMSAFWNRAMANLNNPQKEKQARKTLMFLNHLTQRLDDLEETDRVKTRNLDLTIKMWDRIPQKDLFQGNYSTCCIGMGAINGWSMPVYLLNTVFNMIELVDNNTGEIVGNALCYFVKSDGNKPVFIIDNIEIRNSVKPSDEIGKKLRSAITKYAKNISKDVTGRDNIQILLGTSYNDLPVGDLKKSYSFIKTLGEELRNEVYTDAIDYTKVAVIGESLYKLM